MLNQLDRGEVASADRLLRLVYAELRRIAASRMAHEASRHTLQPTLLVHDAWLRLAGTRHWNWRNRAHFYGAAAEAMRRILIDRARRRRAQRRGGGQAPVTLDGLDPAAPAFGDDRWLALDEALELTHPERGEFLARECGADLALRERIGRLLAAHEKSAGTLEPPLSIPADESSPLPAGAEAPGTRIRRYTLVEKIGEGGCGSVWLAEQDDFGRRRVALKLV